MPLALVPPGERIKYRNGKAYPNQFYLVRGKVGERNIEVSTKTTDEKSAKRFALELELGLLNDNPPALDAEITFSQAAELYVAWRDPSDVDLKRIAKLEVFIGSKALRQITIDDLYRIANQKHPTGMAATKNREVLRPAAAILHHAAETGRCPYMKVKLFKEPRAKTRAVSEEIAKVIVNSLPDLPNFQRNRSEKYLAQAAARQKKKMLLLLWLFRQGTRITDALNITVDRIDLHARTVRMRIGKTDEDDIVQPLHDDVWEALINDPPTGHWLFPWRNRRNVYAWLKPYVKHLGIKFTPHMARHSLGKWLNESGASLRTIMDTLHHHDPKSSIRYQSTDIEVVRQNGRRLGKLTK